MAMPELVRRISWLKAARKEFDGFPQGVQIDMATALTEAARGRKADTAKPFKGSVAAYSRSPSAIEAMLSVRFMRSKSARTFG